MLKVVIIQIHILGVKKKFFNGELYCWSQFSLFLPFCLESLCQYDHLATVKE